MKIKYPKLKARVVKKDYTKGLKEMTITIREITRYIKPSNRCHVDVVANPLESSVYNLSKTDKALVMKVVSTLRKDCDDVRYISVARVNHLLFKLDAELIGGDNA